MNTPTAPDGIFEGAVLFDGCDYRTADGIVDYVHDGDRLGLVRSKSGSFRAEFLTRQKSSNLSLPVWDEAMSRTICSSKEEAWKLVVGFVRPPNEEA
jgi:hypothetical protein